MITLCAYCSVDTGGNHEAGCPCRYQVINRISCVLCDHKDREIDKLRVRIAELEEELAQARNALAVAH